MKAFVKAMLMHLGLFYTLQTYYRHMLFKRKHAMIKTEYENYRGDGLICNVCGASYKKFVPEHPSPENADAISRNHVIAGYGEQVCCPNCMSNSRDRLVIAMLDKINVHGKKILHLAPEKHVFNYVNSRANVVTADLMPELFKLVDRNIHKEDVTNFSYHDDSFDILIGNHIMEHIPDDQKAMREIYRVLKSSGQAILQVPFSSTIRETIEEPDINDPAIQSALFGQMDHIRIYQLDDYLRRLRAAGFDADYISYESLTNLHQFAIQPGEGFIIIRKPDTSNVA
jgi:SAM-dependent methyltransferase